MTKDINYEMHIALAVLFLFQVPLSQGGGGTSILFGVADPNGSPVEFSPTSMTNNTSPAPFVASSSGNFPTYNPYFCWSGSSANQFWIGSGATGWIQIDLGSALAIAATYSIQVNDIPEPNRAPRDWTLQGSNNGTDFTVIDTVTGQTAWTSAQIRTFTVDTQSTAYRYYRVNITLNNGDGSFIQIAKIRLYSAATAVIGKTGDFYYQTNTRKFWGPFDGSSVWPSMGTLNP